MGADMSWVTCYRGWHIWDSGLGYYLIGKDGDVDGFMQAPFSSVKAACRCIDKLTPSSEIVMSFNEHYAKTIMSRSFWLSPPILIFGLMVMFGTFVGVKPDSTLSQDIIKSIFGTTIIFLFFALIPALFAWRREHNQPQAPKQADDSDTIYLEEPTAHPARRKV